MSKAATVAAEILAIRFMIPPSRLRIRTYTSLGWKLGPKLSLGESAKPARRVNDLILPIEDCHHPDANVRIDVNSYKLIGRDDVQRRTPRSRPGCRSRTASCT